MPINHRELMAALAQLADDQNIRVTITQSLKGACLVGAATFFGGIVMGPLGLAVGGIAGGLTAAASSRNQFRPLAQVILQDMSVQQQALLAQRVTNVLKDFSVTDLTILLPMIHSNARLQEALVGALINFAQSEMNLQLTL